MKSSSARLTLAATLVGGGLALALSAQEITPPSDSGVSSREISGASPGTSIGEMETRAWTQETPEAEVGMSNLIHVSGGDPVTRMRFNVFLDDLSDEFRRLIFRWRPGRSIGRAMVWTAPIEVTLWGTFRDVHVGDDVIEEVSQAADTSIRIEVAVQLHDRFDESRFRLEFVRALLLGQMVLPYFRSPETFSIPNGQVLKVPEWLVHGFDQLIEHRRLGSPSSTYRGILASGQVMKPSDLFAVEDVKSFDSVGMMVFRISASALVESLLDQPEGDDSLRSVLMALGRPSHPGIEAMLNQEFPAFRETELGLEKWWSLEIATLGQKQSFEYLNRSETERLLDEALTVHFEAILEEAETSPKEKATGIRKLFKPKGSNAEVKAGQPAYSGPLDQFENFIGRTEAHAQLQIAFERLQRLKRIGFPLYRPVFVEYENAVRQLVKGDVQGLKEKFTSIAEMRQKIRETLIRVEDDLNHFEATRAPTRSDAFDEYFKLRRELDSRPSPKRNDPISRHLDTLEWEFR